jgi:hypothetical protein
MGIPWYGIGRYSADRLGGNETQVKEVKLNFESAAISDKVKALLNIAGKGQKCGKQVTSEDGARSRA